MRERISSGLRLKSESQEITLWPSAESSASKLAGPAAQFTILSWRSACVRENILTYLGLDRPKVTTRSSSGTALYSPRPEASALSRRLTLRAALFG